MPNFMRVLRGRAILDPRRRHKAASTIERALPVQTHAWCATSGAMNALGSAVVAVVVAGLLWLNLDSGLVGPEPAARIFSMPLLGLAAIFGVRAWTETQQSTPRWTSFFAGLALGVGGYGVLRLLII